ncbi:MAG: hydantoinase/carbamoylase family amidase [Deltaproteobacteria bacterium]|nr:hydantoinase/carbamoylase family amidase [Deltaproteobacteria bacterium]
MSAMKSPQNPKTVLNGSHITINKRRLLRDLNAISRIGIGNHGSVTRLVFSIKELRSRQFLIHQMRQIGLQIHIDRIGNIFGKLNSANPKAPAVLAGSHLDTVVDGGKFDGTMGVIAALEAVRTLKEKKVSLQSPVEVVCFVGEESSRFGFSTLGSSLVAGEVHGGDFANATDAHGTKLEDILAGLGIYRSNLRSLRRDPTTVKGYLELHIEQGPILEAIKKPIGVVTAIAAPTRFKAVIIGQADHSGTTPMEMRKDALVAAAELIVAVEKIVRQYSRMDKGRVVGTVGAIKIEPGVINAVPGKTELSVDVRSITAAAKNRAVRLIEAKIHEIARRRKTQIDILPIRKEAPVPLDKRLVHLIKECCEARNISYEIMPSGAGHDAMQMAKITPAGMLFIPSRRGISHSPAEWSDPEDICLGAQLLLDAIVRVANEKI